MITPAQAYHITRLSPSSLSADEASTTNNAQIVGLPGERSLEDIEGDTSYWEVAASKLQQLANEADGKVEPCQVWYVSSVYPEHVTVDEVADDYARRVTDAAERAHWEAAACSLSTIAQEPELAPAEPGL